MPETCPDCGGYGLIYARVDHLTEPCMNPIHEPPCASCGGTNGEHTAGDCPCEEVNGQDCPACGCWVYKIQQKCSNPSCRRPFTAKDW